MKCYQAKAGELNKSWYVIDATDMVVGRLAAQIAPILMGKHRPTYTPHIDTGDFVIVTNVDKVVFTGNKWRQKTYQRYSGHPGGPMPLEPLSGRPAPAGMVLAPTPVPKARRKAAAPNTAAAPTQAAVDPQAQAVAQDEPKTASPAE
jgi:hypothetical protein